MLTEGFWPSWSADGQWIYYASDTDGTNQVWKVPAQGGKPTQITQKGGDAPLESPDGKWLYFRRGGIWRVPVSGGEETTMVGPPVGSFDVTERGVFFDRGSGDFIPASIHFLDFASGGITLVVKPGLSKLNGLSASPNGRSVLFPVREREGSELMVVEGVR
jgi:Tol biopolymer transport system component